jgi:hypothetical protein
MANGNDWFVLDAPCYDFGDRTGFWIEGAALRANFHLRNWPFVTDVSTYYYGPSQGSYWAMQPEMSFDERVDVYVRVSWQNETIEDDETKQLSFVVTWGFGSARPSLDMSETTIPDPVHWEDNFTLVGVVSDVDSYAASLVAVFNDDFSAMYRIEQRVSCNSNFSIQFRLEDADVRGGQHAMDVYAVDETGEVSEPVRFNVTCIAPSAAATGTPTDSPTVTPSPDPTHTATIRVTETPSQSPTPSPSPYLDIEMRVTADVDSKSNFRLQGLRRSDPGAPIGISSRGFDTSYRVYPADDASKSVSGILSRLTTVEENDVGIATNVDTAGSTAVVQFILTNSESEPRNVSIVLSTNIMLGESRHAHIETENNGTSFRIVNGLTHFQVFCRNYPMVIDVDSYWFGPSLSLDSHVTSQVELNGSFDGDSGAIALSWFDRTVPGRTRIVLSTLMSWGEVSNPPKVSVNSSQLPKETDEVKWEENISIGGNIEIVNTDDVSLIFVYLVVDGEVMTQVHPEADGGFTIAFSPSALQLSGGTHVFQIYAVDAAGSIAPIASFSTIVLAPTPPQTATKPATSSPTPSATASASWGDVVDLPWYEDPGVDNAESEITSVEIGRIVIAVGVPIGVILVIGFGFLIHRYRMAVREDMTQQLRSATGSEAGATGMGL